jgi:hypothetical protein
VQCDESEPGTTTLSVLGALAAAAAEEYLDQMLGNLP